MKLTKFFILGLAVVTFASCSSDNATTTKVDVTDVTSTRGIKTVEFQGAHVSISNADIIAVSRKANYSEDDAFIANINRNLLIAESEAQLLNVKFSMSDEPVENGMFVFGVEAEQNKQLKFEMYDEEGFSMAANNSININAGNNYKALNVKSLSDGKYYFKLKDDQGKELTRQVVISHKD